MRDDDDEPCPAVLESQRGNDGTTERTPWPLAVDGPLSPHVSFSLHWFSFGSRLSIQCLTSVIARGSRYGESDRRAAHRSGGSDLHRLWLE